MPKKYWFCSSRVEQWAVNSKVVGSNPTRIATDFVAQLERVFAYEAKGWRFESFQNHTSSLERNKAYWGYWLTFPTVSREKRVRSPYKPQLTDLLISYIWEDNDWLFIPINREGYRFSRSFGTVSQTKWKYAKVGELGRSVKPLSYDWVGSNPTTSTNYFFLRSLIAQ